MPYKDPERQREAERDAQRRRRAAQRRADPARQTTSNLVPLPPGASAADLLELLVEQLNAVRTAPGVRAPERLRAIAYGAGVALRASETADLAERLAAVERALKSEPHAPLNGAKRETK